MIEWRPWNESSRACWKRKCAGCMERFGRHWALVMNGQQMELLKSLPMGHHVCTINILPLGCCCCCQPFNLQIQYRLGAYKEAIGVYSQLFRAHGGEAGAGQEVQVGCRGCRACWACWGCCCAWLRWPCCMVVLRCSSAVKQPA